MQTEPLDLSSFKLRYVTDDRPGITRRRTGKGWSYRDPNGNLIHDEKTLARIRSLAIPPAWTDIWICPYPNGHIQATGRDAKGRKQYRYHPTWREMRDETKYARIIAFAEALPRLRAKVDKDMRRPGLSREKVVATIIRLLETTLIRVGNAEYAKANKSYGLTTLRDRHVSVEGSQLRFRFRGKSGVEHEIELKDRRLANIVKRCQDIPGQTLFQYVDELGERCPIDSSDVNAYLRAAMGDDYTAKDVRTWAGTVLAAQALAALGTCETKTEANRRIVAAVDIVASRLGNTRAVCRKCYIHPAILSAYEEGIVITCEEADADLTTAIGDGSGLSPIEQAVLDFLRERWETVSAA